MAESFLLSLYAALLVASMEISSSRVSKDQVTISE